MNSLNPPPANPNPPGVDFLSVGEAATLSLDTFRSNRADHLLVDSMRGLALSPSASSPIPVNVVETTADGFESFDKFWHSLPFTSPLSADDNHPSFHNANDPHVLAYYASHDDASPLPTTPLPDKIDVELSEYELETDSNASTPAHVRAEREAELERLRIEEEERLEKLRQQKEAAELEEKVKRALKIKAEEAEKMKEEEEERKRIAEEEERIRIAEEKSQAAQAKKEQLKAMAQSVLEEERQIPERRNSSWTKEATARKSILKNRHSIAPIALETIREDEKENDSPPGGPPPLVDYDSESSTWSKRSSVSSRRTSVTVGVMKSTKSKRKSISQGTQAALVDYPKTPKRFSLAYSTTASSPGSSVADSNGTSEPKTIRRRLEEDMDEDVGISVPKLERIRRASLAAPPPKVTERGTMFRESLDAPEMSRTPRPKTKNMIDCAIMCQPELIDAEMEIMFAQFDVTNMAGADIPPVTASQKNGGALSTTMGTPSVFQSPQVTFVEQAVSIQTPGKTVSHEILKSIMTEDPPSSAVRPTEKLLSQVGEGSDALRVVEVDRAKSPENLQLPATPNGNGTETPYTALSTIASSRRDSIMSPPPSSAGASRRRKGKSSSAGTPVDNEDRRNSLMVSAAKPPKSPKVPSYAALSNAKRARRSLRFQNSSPLPAGTPAGMDDDEDIPVDSTTFSIDKNGISPSADSVLPSPPVSNRGNSRRRASRRVTIDRHQDISISEDHEHNHVHIENEEVHNENSNHKKAKRVPRRSTRIAGTNQVVQNVVEFDTRTLRGVAAPRSSTHEMNEPEDYDDDNDIDNGEEEDEDIHIVERSSKNISRRTSSTSTRIDSKSTRGRAATRSSKSSKRLSSHESQIPSTTTRARRSTRSNTNSQSTSPSTIQNSTKTSKQKKANGLRRSSRRTTVESSANASSMKHQRRGTVEQEEIIDIPEDEPLELLEGDESGADGNSRPSHAVERSQKTVNTRGRKRTRKTVMKREILRKQLDDEEEGTSRRGKRARFGPMKYWEGEKVVYERRTSQKLPTIKELAVNKPVDPNEEDESEQEEHIELPILPHELNEEHEELAEEIAEEEEDAEEEEEELEISEVVQNDNDNSNSNFPPDDPQSPEDHGHGIIEEAPVVKVEDERSARRSARKKRKAETVSSSAVTVSKSSSRATKATRTTTTTTTSATRGKGRGRGKGRKKNTATSKASAEVEEVEEPEQVEQPRKKRKPRKRRG